MGQRYQVVKVRPVYISYFCLWRYDPSLLMQMMVGSTFVWGEIGALNFNCDFWNYFNATWRAIVMMSWRTCVEVFSPIIFHNHVDQNKKCIVKCQLSISMHACTVSKNLCLSPGYVHLYIQISPRPVAQAYYIHIYIYIQIVIQTHMYIPSQGLGRRKDCETMPAGSLQTLAWQFWRGGSLFI